MSTIPVSVTEEEFECHIRPHLSTAKRGYISKVPLVKIFNYILYKLHTGMQWYQLKTDPCQDDPEKKKSVGKRCTIIGKNGIKPGVLNRFGNIV